MNVFKELVLSVYDFKSYKKFLENRKFKVFLAGLILMVVYFILTMVVPFVKFQATTGGFTSILEEMVPEFELSNGTLWVETPFEYEYGDTYIYVNTDPDMMLSDMEEAQEYIRNYSQVLLLDSEKMVIKDNGEVQGAYFSDLNLTFSKGDLLSYVPYAYAIVAGFLFLSFIVMTALFFFGVLITALLGMVAASCMKYQLTFGQLYLLGIYARTLPLLIKGVLKMLSITIPFFTIINFGLSVFLIVMAIQKMKEQELENPLEFTSEPEDGRFNQP